jgi:hypothetical protein
MQWHALAVVLSELADQPPSSVTEKAWSLIDAIDWEEPEDRAGRILSQSIKRMLAKAQAHKEAQTNPLHANLGRPEPTKSPQAEPYFVAHGAFDPALLGHNYNAPTNFVNLEDHHPPPFYMGQHISPHDMGQQQPVGNWYFDPGAIQPLQEQEPMGFNAEYWKGWDMVRDDPMHRGAG